MVDFNTSNSGTWFWFDNDDQSLGGVCLRELTEKELKSIEKATTKIRHVYENGRLTESKEVNTDLERKLVINYCITDWKNVSINGEPVECNITSKEKIITSLDFMKFLNGCLEHLRKRNVAIEEARLKNLENLSSGE